LGAERRPDHDAADSARRRRLAAEEKRLRIWARANRRLTDTLPGEDARGGEHTVEFDERTQRILRATRPETRLGYGLAYGSYLQGATPAEYLDRWAIHNLLFGDDVRIERVVAHAGELRVVTSQPFIRGRDATDAEIRAFMVQGGFDPIGPGAFHHRAYGVLADDLFPRNAKVSLGGVVLPIDPVMQRVTPEFADFLRDEFYPSLPAEWYAASRPAPVSPPEDSVRVSTTGMPHTEAMNTERRHSCLPDPSAALLSDRDVGALAGGFVCESAPRAPKLTGLKLELDADAARPMAGAAGACGLRERLHQPRISRLQALRQIAATIPLSDAAQAELEAMDDGGTNRKGCS
jgi:hypothetical protein